MHGGDRVMTSYMLLHAEHGSHGGLAGLLAERLGRFGEFLDEVIIHGFVATLKLVLFLFLEPALIHIT